MEYMVVIGVELRQQGGSRRRGSRDSVGIATAKRKQKARESQFGWNCDSKEGTEGEGVAIQVELRQQGVNRRQRSRDSAGIATARREQKARES
ncbi:hypothetical protein ACOJQI_12730 [Bacillus salacetis]|uniref:hypothetical protein n=1 Tax=Bacillus salacetis TaxID=2315464 RepID=UPI003BA0CC44